MAIAPRTRKVATIAAVLALASTASAATGGERRPVELDTALIRIELNATAEDAGIQMLIDGEQWELIEVFAPSGEKQLAIRARDGVGTMGLTELFFESAEPSLADLPLADLLEMFPEGRYRIEGRTIEGRELVGVARLNHDIPAGPTVASPAEGAETDAGNTVIEWEPVVDPAGIHIAGYQVIVEREDPLRVFSVDLPPSATSVTVAPEFLRPGTDYKFEILAIARGGNQTITESTFTTAS